MDVPAEWTPEFKPYTERVHFAASPEARTQSEARKFLTALDEEAEKFTFQTFADREDASEEERRTLTCILHGTLEEFEPWLRALNECGAGIFVTINATDGRGRTAENITGIRALFADFDGAALPSTWPLEPHIVVESSPGRWHAYWLVCGIELTEFRTFQASIAAHLGSDPKIIDLPRVMRLPGFTHRKGAPFVTRIVTAVPAQPYDRETLLRAFPPRSNQQSNTTRAASGAKVTKGSRNTELTRLAGVWRRVGVPTEGIEAGLIVENPKLCDPPLDATELRSIARSIGKKDPEPRQAPPPELHSVSFTEYVRGYEPAEYVIDGLIQRERVYSITALTGHGKTAIATTLALHLACAHRCGELEVATGAKVLLLSGENDHDQQCRAMATAQHLGLDPGERMRVIAGSYPIAAALEVIRQDAENHGPYGLILADTSIAFFGGDDENDNPQLRAHAASFRELTRLPGRPAVGVLCHPTKNAARDNLIPRGGGAFLNEVDGNLTCWRDGDRLTLHTAGKFRGPVFDPLYFVLKTVQIAGKKDPRGRPVISVVAVPLVDAEAERLARQDWTEENRLLYEMAQDPEGSQAAWARACAWISDDGLPNKAKVYRLLKTMEADKLVRNRRGRWSLTNQGADEAKRAAK